MKLLKKFFQFKNILFITYSCYTFVISLSFALIFYFYTSDILNENSKEVLVQTSEKINVKLDTMLSSMDAACLQVISNSDIRTILLNSNEYQGKYNYFDFSDQNYLNTILISINTPLLNHMRISVIDNQKNFVSVGSSGVDSAAFYQNLNKYDACSQLDRKYHQYLIYPPHKDNWMFPESGKTVISFLRIIPDINNASSILGFVEIEQPYSMIEDACTVVTDPSITVTILDHENQPIYPYRDWSDEDLNHYITLKALEESSKTAPSSGDEYFYQQTISKYGWTIILTQKNADFYRPVRLLQHMLILFFVIFNTFSFLIIFVITKRLTLPISNLRQSMESLSNTNPHIQLGGKLYHNEILLLTDAFNATFDKLTQSMNQTIIANQKQAQTLILAMQAQMNPHFLFNTLMVISGIAEENNDIRIISICDKLSSMLRYISAFKDSSVSMEMEIIHAQNYLELMKVQYEDFLLFSFEIEESILTYPVPKLVLQPIVENCFSHGFKNCSPPYIIRIHGSVKNNFLELTIYDNGEGFSEEYIAAFTRKIHYYKANFDIHNYVHSSELGGLGLTNIYLRLQLKYGSDLQMTLENDDTQGCYVKLAIPFKEEK